YLIFIRMQSLTLFSVCMLALIAIGSANVTPASIKLAYTSHDYEMRVTWYSKDSTATPSIMYSTNMFTPSGAGSTVNGAQATSVSLSGTSGWTGYVNSGIITGLQSMTTYYYTCGDKKTGTWSNVYNFTTGVYPSKSNKVTPYSVVTYGDMVRYYKGLTISNIVGRIDDFSYAMHVGDIAYADSGSNGNQATWDSFLSQVNPITSRLPYMVCPGNHDVFAKEKIYLQTFNMPSVSSGSTWYSYDFNGIHYVSFSSEDTYSSGSAQWNWIESDLKSYRAYNPTGWIVAWAHRPLYCSSKKSWCSPSDSGRAAFIKAIDQLFLKYNVDIFVSGHTHSYERTLPVNNNAVKGTLSAPKATVHFIIGTAGNKEGLIDGWVSLPKWSTGPRIEKTGYGVINFANETHLQWQFLTDSNNAVEDECWVQKGKF
ncbi:hypothetical protein SAMD00019534_051250, partial [Acytostelium subglobosum LB1]|uniref:hypothetical protein n=1 Tax=Acytostelium subglobosum LB1 TaxID=1410327 RepID=UPI000644E897